MNMTIAYIIFAVVLLHLLLGFAWVIYKFSKKNPEKLQDKEDAGKSDSN